MFYLHDWIDVVWMEQLDELILPFGMSSAFIGIPFPNCKTSSIITKHTLFETHTHTLLHTHTYTHTHIDYRHVNTEYRWYN